jgi:hypothetical protein
VLLDLLMVVEVLASEVSVLVGGRFEVAVAGRLVVIGMVGEAAAGRRLVMRAAATPTTVPKISAARMMESSGRLARHHGRLDLPGR